MASIDKSGNHIRVRGWDGVKNREWTIPLKTNNKTFKLERLKAVEEVESHIKEGTIQKYQFPEYFRWLNDKGTSLLILKRLEDVIEEYIKERTIHSRPSTVKRDEASLAQLRKQVGNIEIRKFNKSHIDGINGFKAKMGNATKYKSEESYSTSGINISLRHIRTFCNWCYENEYIDRIIKYKLLDEGSPLYCYFNEHELKQIYELEIISDFHKRAFYFYQLTGVRPSEALLGELIGGFLIIEGTDAKNRKTRQIELDSRLITIRHELEAFRDTFSTGVQGAVKHLQDVIRKKVIPNIEVQGRKKLSLKSFRHSYGIVRVTVSGDIHQVAREMGHSKTTTTEKYLRFPEVRRVQDFPSLKPIVDERKNRENRLLGGMILGEKYKNSFLSPR